MSPLGSLVLIATAGAGSQWLGWRLRVPAILPLLGMGLLLGPGLGLLQPDPLLGSLLGPLVSLAVAVVLFEGGLTLDLAELRSAGGPVLRMVTAGVLLTWGLTYGAARLLLETTHATSLVLGAILTVTGPTVVAPLLNHVRPSGSVGPLLKWEGIVADVIGATLAVLTLGALVEGTASPLGITLGLLRTLGAGLLVGGLSGLLLVRALERQWIPDRLEAHATLALIGATYFLGDSLVHEAGLVAVTLQGFLLANQKRVRVAPIIEFKEHLATMLLGALFVVLAARIQREELLALDLGAGLFVAALILVIRPAAVMAALQGTSVPLREKALVAGIAPRGVVAVSVAALFATRLGTVVPDAERLVPTVFAVVLGTVLVYGLGAGPLARRLGLATRNPEGLLLIGASPFSVALAQALVAKGIPTVLADKNPERLATARLSGVRTALVDATAPHAARGIPMGGLGRALALTPNHDVNRLATQQFEEFFGRGEVYRLPDGREDHEIHAGRSLFSEAAQFGELARRMAEGQEVRFTQLTEQFDFPAFEEQHAGQALPLLRQTPSGRVHLFTIGQEPGPVAGDLLAYLGPESPREPVPGAGSES